MIKNILFGIIFGGVLALLGCKSQWYSLTTPNDHLSEEHWMKEVVTHPDLWTKKADSWFLTGNPNRIERNASRAPYSAAITVMAVKVPHFTKIEIDGDFQVQITGQPQNSVAILGTNASARDIVVENRKDTLAIHRLKGATPIANSIIVRIGVNDLRSITNLGNATILGRHIISRGLAIKNCSSGTIMLTGNINLTNVTELGDGTVTVLNACTPNLTISVTGNGNVYISGHVGVRCIDHTGNGQVSIIGADTNSLTINSGGCGLTTVFGFVNLKLVNANDSSCVYVYWVCNKQGLQICQTGTSLVGIAGVADTINVDLSEATRFQGHYLRTNYAYVTTRHSAHANVTTSRKVFANASGSSSIYVDGLKENISSQISGNAVVLPLMVNPNPIVVQASYPVL